MRTANKKRGLAAGGILLLATGSALRRRHLRPAPQPKEIAPDVWWLKTGRGLSESNVYFVRSGSSWVLIDAAWPACGQMLTQGAAALFGPSTRAAAILLTHIHKDHSGAAVELARQWECPVFVHPNELPFAVPRDIAAIERYANPLDRWIILPLLRAMPRARVAALLSDTSLADVTRAFDPDAVPGLPDWQCIPTPGHTPGHVAFFRPSDRVLIAGDALTTVNLNSVWDVLLQKQKLAAPPSISTWSWQATKDSIAVLARLEPRVIGGGHGNPMRGPATARALYAFAERAAGSGADRRSAAYGAHTNPR